MCDVTAFKMPLTLTKSSMVLLLDPRISALVDTHLPSASLLHGLLLFGFLLLVDRALGQTGRL